MKSGVSWKSRIGLRLATLILPPLGLLLLWRSESRLGRKFLGTIGIAFYSTLYSALICWLLIQYDGLMVEWRGGYIPALTFHKTAPNYETLESQRARQNALPIVAPVSTNHSAYWSGFRGPNRDGRYDESPILTNWPSSGLRLLWRQPCGDGYASFAVANGLTFTIEQRRDQEVVAAYDLGTGKEVWTQGWKDSFTESMGGNGPRATPAWSEGRIYSLGALGDLRCLEANTSKLVWSHNIVAETHAGIPTYGVSASPLVLDDKIIVLTSAGHGKSVLCYQKADGRLLWGALDDVTGYASPALLSLAGRSQIVICCETRTVGLRIEDGQVLWSYPWRVLKDRLPVAQPVLIGTNR